MSRSAPQLAFMSAGSTFCCQTAATARLAARPMAIWRCRYIAASCCVVTLPGRPTCVAVSDISVAGSTRPGLTLGRPSFVATFPTPVAGVVIAVAYLPDPSALEQPASSGRLQWLGSQAEVALPVALLSPAGRSAVDPYLGLGAHLPRQAVAGRAMPAAGLPPPGPSSLPGRP